MTKKRKSERGQLITSETVELHYCCRKILSARIKILIGFSRSVGKSFLYFFLHICVLRSINVIIVTQKVAKKTDVVEIFIDLILVSMLMASVNIVCTATNYEIKINLKLWKFRRHSLALWKIGAYKNHNFGMHSKATPTIT